MHISPMRLRIPQEQEAIKQRKNNLPASSSMLPEDQYLSGPEFAVPAARQSHPRNVLAMQQTRGNAAVCRMLAVQSRALVCREPDPEIDDDQLSQSPAETVSGADSPSTTTSVPGDSVPDAQQTEAAPSEDDISAASTAAPTASSQPPPSDTFTPDSTTDSEASTDAGPITGGPVQGQATPAEAEANGGCQDLDLQGLTRVQYGGGFSAPTINYANVGSDVRATGTMTNVYTDSTDVTLPDLPSGLSDCETDKANSAIQTILAPHENKHVAAYDKYAGQTVHPFSVTLPGMNTSAGADALDTAVQPLLQALYDTEKVPRQDKTDKASKALDPFHFNVDCSDCN